MEPRRRFRFLKAISEGSFGKVYLAEMVTGDNFSTVVAIKLLHGKWLGHEEIVMRSRDEARLLGLLRHQNIVRVEDLSSINGQCAVIMEYLEGVDLKHMSTFLTEKGELFPRRAAIEAAAAIASALDAAYNHRPLQGGKPLRVIHRDIKPSNAMITSAGQVKVLDFGTARANFEDREAQTQALAFGSQAYMAPERMMGDPDTPAADVFSLGITLWEILTGERFGKIFIREARYQTALEQRVAQIDLSMLDDTLAEQLRELLLQMMEYEPTARPTASEVMDKLEEYSERAPDMGLRRLCRAYVKEAMGRREPQEIEHDPLTGTTLVEDRSSAFVRGTTATWSDEVQDPQGSSASLAQPPTPAQEEQASGSWLQDNDVAPMDDASGAQATGSDQPVAADDPAPAGDVHETLVPPSDVSDAPPSFAIPEDLDEPSQSIEEEPADNAAEPGAPQPKGALDTFDLPPDSEAPAVASGPVASGPVASGPISPQPAAFDDEPAPRKGKGLMFLFMAIGLIAVVVVGGGGVAFLAMMKNRPTDPGPTELVQPVPDQPTDPEPASMGVASDTVGDVVLSIQPSAGGTVTITSALGFKQTWDGADQRTFEKIPAGTYRTKVKTPDGNTIRSTFDVAEDQTCTYTLDLSAGSEEWAGGCE
jgi:serine/threonine protein kinase